jgi:DNA-directed RNA polymerase specialized sigma subunit
MPVNHDQFTAGDRFAKMLDEKMELERALAEAEEMDEMELALKFLGSRSRMFLKRFYTDSDRQNTHSLLMKGLGISSTQVYRERDEALDKLYSILYAEV